MAERMIGRALSRREDRRLLRGTGRFVDDFTPPGAAHMAVLRSPFAHARIRSVDLAAAQRELAGDWIAAYKRRFDTDRPLRDYDRFPLTARDVEALQAEARERRLLHGGRRS